jgi:hypothetical protein
LVKPWHSKEFPEIVGVGAGLTEMAFIELLPLPHEFVPITDTFPDVVPRVTVMLLVLAPEVIVDPVGTVQIYPVALAIGGTEYTFPILLPQALAGPVITPAGLGIGQLVVRNVISSPLPVPTLLMLLTL